MRAAREPGEHEKQNVQTFFDRLVEDVPIDERGHTGKVPDRLGHVDAAHKWGVLYMDAQQALDYGIVDKIVQKVARTGDAPTDEAISAVSRGLG